MSGICAEDSVESSDDREASPALTVASSRKGKQTPQLRAEGAAASSVGFQVDQFDFMWLSCFLSITPLFLNDPRGPEVRIRDVVVPRWQGTRAQKIFGHSPFWFWLNFLCFGVKTH